MRSTDVLGQMGMRDSSVQTTGMVSGDRRPQHFLGTATRETEMEAGVFASTFVFSRGICNMSDDIRLLNKTPETWMIQKLCRVSMFQSLRKTVPVTDTEDFFKKYS